MVRVPAGIVIAKFPARAENCFTDMAETAPSIIGIAGSGRMGADILNFLSGLGLPLVWLCESATERDAQLALFRKKADRQVRAGAITGADRDRLIDTMKITCEVADLAPVDLVIEAIPEDAGAKRVLFNEMEKAVRPDAVIATNTSSIRPSLLLCPDMRRERYAGLHFFYPVKLKNIAEIIVTDHTNEMTLELLRGFLKRVGKFHIEMHERNGFMLNRVFLDLQAQAWRYCAEGVARMRCVDSIVRDDLFPSGVFAQFDAIGLDVVLPSVIRYNEYGEDAALCEPLVRELQRLVSLGRLGCKSGEGFYRYGDGKGADAASCDAAVRREISSVLRALYINAACRALETRICSREELEFALKEYTDAEKGPFALLDETGPRAVMERLEDLHAATGYSAYTPSGMLMGLGGNPPMKRC
jgi:3-hydroxybutyryl-CoA dehydrogenase